MFKITLPLLILLAGCTSLHVNLPVTRFELPETNGVTATRFQLQATAEPSHKYTVSDDASIRPPNLAAPKVEHSASLGAYGSFALLENLDLSLRTSVGRSPFVFNAKYQFLGSSFEAAAPGEWSLAVSGGLGYGSSSTSGDQNGLLGAGGYNWDAKIESRVTDAAILVGYRSSETVLIYASGFYTNYGLEAKINHAQSDNGTSPAAEYRKSSSAYQRGANLGLAFDFGNAGIIKVETAYSDLVASPASDNLWSYGASIGGRF